MKKVIYFTLILLILGFVANSALAVPEPEPVKEGEEVVVVEPITVENPCVERPIVIPRGRARIMLDTFKNALRDYASDLTYFNEGKNRYELCFVFDEALEISEPIVFETANDGIDIYFQGINLIKAGDYVSRDPLFDIRNNDQEAGIEIYDSIFANVYNGLKLTGSNISVYNSTFTGDGQGSCLFLHGSYMRVQRNDISGCYTGVYLKGDDSFLGSTSMNPDSRFINIIHNNSIGIFWAGGERNKFYNNKIYANRGDDGGDVLRSEYAIYTTERFRTAIGVIQPEVIMNEDFQALRCDSDEDNNITRRYLMTEQEEIFGEQLVIYLTDPEGTRDYQAHQLFTTCTIDEEGNCEIDFDAAGILLPIDQCGVAGLRVVALVNMPLYTTPLTLEPFELSGSITMIRPEGVELDSPVGDATGDGDGDLGLEDGDEGLGDLGDKDGLDDANGGLGDEEIGILPIAPTAADAGSDVDDDQDNESSSDGENLTHGLDAGGTDGGSGLVSFGAGGAPGGGCGGILVPTTNYNFTSALAFYWILFTCPIAVFAYSRKRH